MTKEKIISLREAAEKEAERTLQCAGEYHPDYHEVADACFFRMVRAELIEDVIAFILYKHYYDPYVLVDGLRAMVIEGAPTSTQRLV